MSTIRISLRRNDPKLLVKAVTKILPRLVKRAEGMKESETKAWIEKSLRNFDDIKDKLKERNDEVKGIALFLLWGRKPPPICRWPLGRRRGRSIHSNRLDCVAYRTDSGISICATMQHEWNSAAH